MESDSYVSDDIIARLEADAEAREALMPFAVKSSDCIRRQNDRDVSNVMRPAFSRDVDKILNSKFFNRMSDKTQVFSFFRNDDITRRALHVQLVSRIARQIGSLLGLNLDLIEAIALGHDIGHTPFGHVGETYLSSLYQENTGRIFSHNVHSVRVLDGLLKLNLSLQTLDGVLCHNGEKGFARYEPVPLSGFEEFDRRLERCYTDEPYIRTLRPSTLEACVVRISDMIAYIGKDRQDAYRAGFGEQLKSFTGDELGFSNSNIIRTLLGTIISNSYGKDYLSIDPKYSSALENYKAENYSYIYRIPEIIDPYSSVIQPMFGELYTHFLDDLRRGDESSVIYRHHVLEMQSYNDNYIKTREDYLATEPNQIVVDYIASMTDDYFLDVYKFLFPQSPLHIEYRSYFDDMEKRLAVRGSTEAIP